MSSEKLQEVEGKDMGSARHSKGARKQNGTTSRRKRDSLLEQILPSLLVISQTGRDGDVVEDESMNDGVLDGSLLRAVEAEGGGRRGRGVSSRAILDASNQKSTPNREIPKNSHVVEVTPDSISNSSSTRLVLLGLDESLDSLSVGAARQVKAKQERRRNDEFFCFLPRPRGAAPSFLTTSRESVEAADSNRKRENSTHSV